MTHRIQLGKWGEDRAVEFLQEKGFTILARNYRSPYGEMDVIAQIDGKIVFVEVKTRSSRVYGYPEEAITAKKRAHLEETAQAYMLEHPEMDGEWRIDVIAIEIKPGAVKPDIEWFENAI